VERASVGEVEGKQEPPAFNATKWRLIVEFVSRSGPNNNVCAVKEITNHYE
jgi:hypothetical protein